MRKKLTLHLFSYHVSRGLSISLAVFAIASCSTGYRAQPIDLPSDALEKAIEDASDDPHITTTECLPQDWWTIFNDSQLTGFIETTLANYPTLQAAYARTLAAGYNADRLRSVLYPNITWAADVSRQKFSETGIIPFGLSSQLPSGNTPLPATGGVNGIPIYFTQWETEFSLNFDFDIWGKNRNSWLAALSEVQSNIADEAFVRLKMSIDVAKVYFRLQIDYKRQKIAQEYVENNKSTVEYYQRRIQANVDNGLSLNVAEANLAFANQSLLKIQGDIAVNEHQLKTYLAGDFTEEIADTKIVDLPLPSVPVPTDVPLHLISRRPDIVGQLWMIESAGKQISVAKAGFYPDFNLAAIFGFQTIHLHKLFLYKSTFFDIDPAVSLPIFDGGRLQANLQGSKIYYDLAIYKYNELVLNAAKEVLDGIIVLRNADQQVQEYSKSVEYQENILQLNKLRVSGNLSSSINTLTSQSNVYVARDQEVVALGNTIQAMLDLIKALGGGYDRGPECL